MICFTLAINNITVNLPEDIKFSLHVDDLVIYIEAKKRNFSDRLLQRGISSLEEWAKKKGVKLSKSNTVALKS